MKFWLAITKGDNTKKVMEEKKYALKKESKFNKQIKAGDKLVLYGSPKKIFAIYEIISDPSVKNTDIFWKGEKAIFNLKELKCWKIPLDITPYINKLDFLANVQNKKRYWQVAIMGRSLKPISESDYKTFHKNFK